MPRRSTLSATEREHLLALPKSPEEFIRQYTFSEADLSLIHQHRGAANRLGFAVQLCYLRFPGVVLGMDQLPAPSVLAFVATQLKLTAPDWAVYGQREQTRREHLLELQAAFGFQTFGLPHYRAAVPWLAEVARQTDKGVVLVQALMGHLRRQGVLLPAVTQPMVEATTRTRWQVEEFHRSFKQLTGAEKCQCRRAQAQRNHLACCYLAWVSLRQFARHTAQTLYQAHQQQWAPYLRQLLAKPLIPALLPTSA